MSEYGKGKGQQGVNVDCEAMKAEGGSKGRGVLVKGILTCRVADAEAVTWSEMAESEASASPHLAVAVLESYNLTYRELGTHRQRRPSFPTWQGKQITDMKGR